MSYHTVGTFRIRTVCQGVMFSAGVIAVALLFVSLVLSMMGLSTWALVMATLAFFQAGMGVGAILVMREFMD